MRLIIYLCSPLTWIYLFAAALSPVLSANGECDVNICDEGDPGFLCATGSFIVIQQVMCRTRGRNCDMVAFRETMRLCAGRQYCDSSDLWLVSGKYCERNERKQFLSIVFVSYACVKVKAVASDCTQRGTKVTPYQRFISSPGYPALVTGTSGCTWKLQPPPGMHTDIFIREYLHLDSTEQQYLRIREMAPNGDVLNLVRTSKRELTTTIAGDVEISLHTDDSTKGHRMFIEYRYVTPPLEHLRPFPVPNKTECGASLLNKTVFPGRHGNPNDIIKPVPNIPVSSTIQTTPLSLVLTTVQTTSQEEITQPTTTEITTTTAPKSRPNITGTEVRENDRSNTALIVATAVCAVGVSCCVVAIVVGCRHRKKKKSSAHGRNCLTTDSYSVEYDRASLSSTPSSHPYSRPSPLVTSPRHYPHHADRVDFVRQSESVHLKTGFYSPQDTIIEASPFEDTYTEHEQLDRNGVPLDLSKYLITDSDNTMDTSTSKASSRSSNGHIYDVVREH